MGLVDRIGQWLTEPGSRSQNKGHPDLYPIEVGKLTKDLGLAAEARRLGEAGLPASDAIVPSGPEAAVIQRVERARQDYVDWAALRLNVLSRDLGRRNVTSEVNRALQADREFERKASTLLSEQDSLLRRLSQSARAKNDELAAFRARHQLVRDAHYPTSAGTYFRVGLLFFLILIEGMLNASFFATGLETGWLGGLFEAGIAATLNVGVAFALGKYLVPFVNHTNRACKLAGLLGLVFALAVMLSIGLSISHYRDALTSEALNASSVAQQTLLTAPFGLKPGSSWALLAISISFALVALFDGLFSDDTYPRYGAVARRAREASEDYETELEDLRHELEELKDQELKALDQTVEQSQASVAAFESTMRDKTSAGLRLSTAIRDADNSLDALLRVFRTENELHRNGVARPSYFDKPTKLREIDIPSFDTTSDEAVLAEQREQVRTLLAEVQAIRGRIQAAFNQQFDRLKPLDAHFPPEGLS